MANYNAIPVSSTEKPLRPLIEDESWLRRHAKPIASLGVAAMSLVALGSGAMALKHRFLDDNRTPFAMSFTFPHCQGHESKFVDVTLPNGVSFQFAPENSDRHVTGTVKDAGQIDYDDKGVSQPHPNANQSPDTRNFQFSPDDRFAIVARPAVNTNPAIQNRTDIHFTQIC